MHQSLELLAIVVGRLGDHAGPDDRCPRRHGAIELSPRPVRVAQRVDPRTWEVFQLLSQDRRQAEDVAEQFGMTLAAVYMAKSRVMKMLKEEVRILSHLVIAPARGRASDEKPDDHRKSRG